MWAQEESFGQFHAKEQHMGNGQVFLFEIWV